MKKLALITVILSFILINLSQAQITQEWSVVDGTTNQNSLDRATCSVSDNTGHTYVCGLTSKIPANGSKVLFVEKINSTGQLVWNKEFDVSINDIPRIALDNNNNIIVATPEAYHHGIKILKLNDAGNTIWSLLHDSLSIYDVSHLAIDGNNNIIIGATNGNFNIIKYTTNGTLSFHTIIDAGNNDVIAQLSIINDNDIIFSGNKYNGGVTDQNARVYRISSNGNILWNTLINLNTENQTKINDHIITGNQIFVCGQSFSNANGYGGFIAKLDVNGNQIDYFTQLTTNIEYNLIGAQQNDLVICAIINNQSVMLRKTTAYQPVWNFTLPVGGKFIELLTHNNIIYTLLENAISTTEVKDIVHSIAPSGSINWTIQTLNSTYHTRSKYLSISSNGTLRHAGSYKVIANTLTDVQLFDINLNNGQVNWTNTFAGTAYMNDRLKLTAGDAQGNIYAAGTFEADYTDEAIGIVKYNQAGQLLWSKRLNYGSGAQKTDEPMSITLDAAGNLIVAGYATYANRDFLLIKLNSDGEIIWEKIFNGTGNNLDQFNSVVTDNNSNIYVAGLSVKNFGGNNNYYVHQVYKYSPDGTLLWENWDYSNNNGKQIIRLSPSQQMVYVACEYYGNTTNPSDIGVFKLRADNGSYLHWAKYNGTSSNSNDRIKGLVIGADEKVYLCGDVNNSGLKIALLKFDSALSSIWTKIHVNNSTASQLYMDNYGDLIICANGTTADAMELVKYNANGTIIWNMNVPVTNGSLSGKFIEQLSDSTYVLVSSNYLSNFGYRPQIDIIKLNGSIIGTYLDNNFTDSYIRAIKTYNNSVSIVGFTTTFTYTTAFSEDYFINKYLITNNSGNQPPSLNSLPSINACTIDGPQNISIIINDEDPDNVILTATSSNTSVLANSSLQLSGTGTNRTLTINYAGSNPGQTTITLTATDANGNSAQSSFTITIDLCTSIPQTDLNDFTIYPNPSSDVVIISGAALLNNTLEIINLNGQVVTTKQLTSTISQVDVSEFPAGLYHFRITSNDGKMHTTSIQVLH